MSWLTGIGPRGGVVSERTWERRFAHHHPDVFAVSTEMLSRFDAQLPTLIAPDANGAVNRRPAIDGSSDHDAGT